MQFADLKGDGRVEYLKVNDDGSVECWLNAGGPDNGPNRPRLRGSRRGGLHQVLVRMELAYASPT